MNETKKSKLQNSEGQEEDKNREDSFESQLVVERRLQL